jgi:hypothetical protein
VLTPVELAERLRVSVRTIELEIADGKLAIDSAQMISEAELARYLEACRLVPFPKRKRKKPLVIEQRQYDGSTLTAEQIVAAAVPFRATPGVYFLVAQGEVVYVGQSVNVYARVQGHAASKKFDSWFYVPAELAELNDLERLYIEALAPPLNVAVPSAPPRRLCA